MKLKVIEKREEVPGVVTFILESNPPLSFIPGQYLHYVLHHEPTDDRGSDRWFTNAAAPFEGHVQITTRIAEEKGSSFKKKLLTREVGKEIEASVIEGDFTLDFPEKEHVFIAGGIGITPYRSIIKQLEYEKKPLNITLIYANRDENVVFKEELDEIASKNPEFKIHYLYSPEHINEEIIRKYVPDLVAPVFYISGPEPMVDSLGEVLKKMEISEDRIKQDWFPGYPAE